MGSLGLFLLLSTFWPSCPAEGWVTSEYGYRTHPITKKRALHAGVDIGNMEGTPVYSPWSAVVVKARKNRDFGWYIILVTGKHRLLMAHMNTLLVKEGQVVSKETVVGLMGHTGRATGTHLHLEWRVEYQLNNPRTVLVACENRD